MNETQFEKMILQLKLITNEIQLLRAESQRSSLVYDCSTIKQTFNYDSLFEINKCRRCKEDKKILKSSQWRLCEDCRSAILDEFESDDEEIK